MKNIFKTLLASLILMTSCTADKDSEVAIVPSVKKFFASIEAPSTRTYADKDGKLLWNANDMITAFYGDTYPRQFKFLGEDGKNYGEFQEINAPTGSYTANSLNANYAIYPYHEKTEISNEGKISYIIPEIQSYAENSFGLGANVMVAVTKDTDSNFLAFKNLCGYFEFSLYGEGTTVKSIEFKGNNGEDLAGAVTITATHSGTPTFEFTGDTSKTLTLDCGDGVALGADAENATTFWFVVPAITYSNGITITITDTEGKVMEKSTSNSIIIERSTIQPLRAFLVETATPETWKIYYTATQKVTPNATNVFGANIVSNEWNEMSGEGIITFDDEITSIGLRAFQNCTSLTNITIPNNVNDIGTWAFMGCI